MKILIHEKGKHDPSPSSNIHLTQLQAHFMDRNMTGKCYNCWELTQEKSHHDFRAGNERQGLNEKVINQTSFKLNLFHQKAPPKRVTKARCRQRKDVYDT